MSDWEFYWPMPSWVVMLIAGLSIAVAWMTYRFRTRLAWQCAWTLVGLRATVLILLLVMVSGFTMARFQLQKPELVVLVDDSASMQALSPTRIEQAIQILHQNPRRLSDLQQRYDVQLRSLSGTLDDTTDVVAAFPSSPLGSWLSQTVAAQRGRKTAAIVLLSDGIVTEGVSLDTAANRAVAQQIPVLAIGLGSGQPPVDIKVEDILNDRWALVGDRVELRTTVRIEGLAEGQTVEVELIDQQSAKVLAKQTLRATGQTRVEPVTLTMLADRQRVAKLSIAAQAFPGERNTDNNRQQVEIEFRDQQLKVLLVQDQPSYEFRYLKHLLERVQTVADNKPLIDLTVVLQSGDPRYANQDQSAEVLPPVGREQLATFDTVILSDAAVALLGRVFLEQLAESVEQQGVGLVVVVGPKHLPSELAKTPLESLLPVQIDSVNPPNAQLSPLPMRLTLLGQQTASMQLTDQGTATLPHLTAVWRANLLQPLARVLLETNEPEPAPVVVTQLVGAGQVRLQLTDELFRMQSFDGTGSMYERYWLQCIRELARGKRRAAGGIWGLVVEGGPFAAGQSVPLQATVPGKPEQVRVRIHDGDQQRTVALRRTANGDYRGTVNGLPPGQYRALLVDPIDRSVEPPSDSFLVTTPPSEQDDLQSDIAALRRVAEVSGGTYLSPDEALTDQLEAALPKLEPTKVQPLPAKPLWNHPLTATVLFACLCSEWLLRRRWGML